MLCVKIVLVSEKKPDRVFAKKVLQYFSRAGACDEEESGACEGISDSSSYCVGNGGV